MKRNIYWVSFLLPLFLFSCTNDDAGLQVVRHSSELLQCEKIFAKKLDAIEERNEILIQTGSIDTTSEQPAFKAAIIHVNDKEIVLTFQKTSLENSVINEVYSGDAYQLTLSYKTTKDNYGRSVYTGKFTIENNKLKKEAEIEGRDCNL